MQEAVRPLLANRVTEQRLQVRRAWDEPGRMAFVTAAAAILTRRTMQKLVILIAGFMFFAGCATNDKESASVDRTDDSAVGSSASMSSA